MNNEILLLVAILLTWLAVVILSVIVGFILFAFYNSLKFMGDMVFDLQDRIAKVETTNKKG